MFRLLPLKPVRTESSSLLVEVAGPRGVGKSTFADLLRERLSDRQVDCGRLAPAGRSKRAYAWLVKAVGRQSTRSLWSNWGPLTAEDLRTCQKRFWTYRHRLWRIGRSQGMHIVDEGVYQLILTLTVRMTPQDPGSVERRLRRMVRFPDIVIFVSAAEEEIRARRKLRGNARDLLRLQVSAAGTAATRALRELLEQLPPEQGEVIFVQSTDLETLTRAADEVAARLADRARDPAIAAVAPRSEKADDSLDPDLRPAQRR